MTAIPIEARLEAAGLRLGPDDVAALGELAADLEVSAKTVRRAWSYRDEPVQALRLDRT